jgi:putative lipoprotein
LRGEGKGEGRKPRSNPPGIGRTLGYYALAFLAALTALASPARAEQKTLTGTVAYDGRIPLPSSALLEVRLVDKSIPGVAPRVVTRSVQAADGDPIAFKLSFDDTSILSGHRYALDARIGSATAIWFASGDESTIDPLSTRYPVRLSVGMIARPAVDERKPDAAGGGDPDADDNFDN